MQQVPAVRDGFDVVVVGGGAAGIGVTASLLRRQPGLRIGVIEPSAQHFYQPAWTLVGGGAFAIAKTMRPTRSVMPTGATWIPASARGFEPALNRVHLDKGGFVSYEQLIVCPGLRLAWEKIDGLSDTLGQHGVTSNYRYDLAPYTWELVQNLRHGVALFTQPLAPIKCAGAPQKAMYLACSHWQRSGVLGHMQVEFDSADGALFGVAAFIPSLMHYVARYGIALTFHSTLIAVDGPVHKVWFETKDAQGQTRQIEKTFSLLHVVPPQIPHDFLRHSPLANASGWCAVDPATLRHPHFENVFGIGDCVATSNAKTAAAARKHIVTVAQNLLAVRAGKAMPTRYDGYGSCPLTVEHGRIVLAEFGYGGKLLPTFPLDPTVPRRSAWFLKTKLLPWIYWHGMLRGREWLAQPMGN